MEKFCQHIEKLLAHHDFVVVPDLGGFVLQNQSAVILKDCIIPPLAVIAFNPLMQHSDGLLAIEISRSERISYRMAMEYISKEVEAIRFRLSSSGEIKLGNLGYLIVDESGILNFRPHEKNEFLPQNFGLTNLYVRPIELQLNKKSDTISIQFRTSHFYKYAAAILLFVGLFLTTNRVTDVQQVNQADFSSFSFLKPIEISTDSIIVDSIDTTLNSENPILPEANFHVIVASLATQEMADNFCKKLIENQFPNAQVLEPIRTYRVAIQSFTQRAEAIQYMENLRKTDSRFETAWVLCN